MSTANTVMTSKEIASVRAVVNAHGLNEAARRLGPNRATVVTILARLGVLPGTVALVRVRLAQMAKRGKKMRAKKASKKS